MFSNHRLSHMPINSWRDGERGRWGKRVGGGGGGGRGEGYGDLHTFTEFPSHVSVDMAVNHPGWKSLCCQGGNRCFGVDVCVTTRSLSRLCMSRGVFLPKRENFAAASWGAQHWKVLLPSLKQNLLVWNCSVRLLLFFT